MSTQALSPRSQGLHEQNQNVDLAPSPGRRKSKAAFASPGKAKGSQDVGFQIGGGNEEELTPKRKARRSMKPRKSILKAKNRDGDDDETMNYTISRQITGVQFSAIAVAGENRRVSFAPNAHVRMFEGTKSKRASMPAQSSLKSGRRSSTSKNENITMPHNITILPQSKQSQLHSPAKNQVQVVEERFMGEGESQGEASMDIDTASEKSDSSGDDEEDAAPLPSSRRQSTNNRLSAQGMPAPRISIIAADEEASMEMDMDQTQIIYGGIISRRQSTANSEISEGDGSTIQSNQSNQSTGEEQTMDFTIAVGGFLPASPPVNSTTNNRASIGYSVSQSPNSIARRLRPGQAMEDEIDMDMDETVAIGGIIGDDTLSSNEDTDNTGIPANRERTMTFSLNENHQENEDGEGMEMTVAMGGILSASQSSQTSNGSRKSLPKSPMPSKASLTPNGTPSFARPTLSSSTRSVSNQHQDINNSTASRKNPFAPSPSPGEATPKKSGMQTAEEVAKKLNFVSTPGSASGTTKRKRGIELSSSPVKASPAKKRAIEIDNNSGVFNSINPNLGNSVSGASRRQSGKLGLGTPRKSLSLSTQTPYGKSPAKSPMLRKMLGQGQTEEEGEEGEFEPPTITLNAFLEMAGVQFIESLAPSRRRSSVGRGVLGHATEKDFGLNDYAAATVQGVFLNMYNWASNKMKLDISEANQELHQTETDCSLLNPPVIKEYLSANDEEKKIFELTFKAFKTNTQLKAKERWYDWKLDLMSRVRPDVEEFLDGMKEDENRLSEMQESLDGLLPELRRRQEELMKEVQRERDNVKEVAECNQEELKEMRAAISEQGIIIEGMSKDVSDTETSLEKLETNLSELKSKKSEAVGAINIAKGLCDRFTKSDVVKLQEEYNSLQSLHLWHITKISSKELSLTYDSEFELSIQGDKFHHDPKTIQLRLSEKEECKDWLGFSPTKGLFELFRDCVGEMSLKSNGDISQFIQRVGTLYSAIQRIRQEIRLLHIHYPLMFSYDQTNKQFMTGASVIFPTLKSKVQVQFMFDMGLLFTWPEGVADVDVVVKRTYGNVDTDNLKEIAKRTISMAHSEGYLGYLLQACVDVSGI